MFTVTLECSSQGERQVAYLGPGGGVEGPAQTMHIPRNDRDEPFRGKIKDEDSPGTLINSTPVLCRGAIAVLFWVQQKRDRCGVAKGQ